MPTTILELALDKDGDVNEAFICMTKAVELEEQVTAHLLR
jgi:hypothetical protein